MAKQRVPRKPDPAPLETDDRRPIAAVMVGFAVAFVVLVVFFRHDLSRHHTTWWLWTCLIGIALGAYGLWSDTRRRRHLAATEEARAKEPVA